MTTIIPFRNKENKDKQDKTDTTEMEYKPIDPVWAFRWAKIDNGEKE